MACWWHHLKWLINTVGFKASVIKRAVTACSTEGLKILYYKNCNDIKGINQSHMKSSVKDLIGWCSVMDSFCFIHVGENATKSFWKHRLLEFKIWFFKIQALTSKIVRTYDLWSKKDRVCAVCELLVTLALGFSKWTAQRQIRTEHKPTH